MQHGASRPVPFDLWPSPSSIEFGDSWFVLPDTPTISYLSAHTRPSDSRRESYPGRAPVQAIRLLRIHGMRPQVIFPAAQASISLRRKQLATRTLIQQQSYKLVINQRGITITSDGEAGLFYGICTLNQCIAAQGRALRHIEISDRPDFQDRGILLDISRNKVPTMATLYALIDHFALWKINQIQLYTEHTFAYSGHENVWHDASPMTSQEIRDLDDYAHQRFIELIPNQNSFGHLHRWLVHSPYRQLAECPEGIQHPFSAQPGRKEPYSLCPTDPRSLDLISDLYDQLLPNFRSASINVGLDETIDLGRGRSKRQCDEKGKQRVYLEYLTAIHRIVTKHGHRMHFWADMIVGDSSAEATATVADVNRQQAILRSLPRDAIPLIWGYERGHPFSRYSEIIHHAGLEFYVCPGTSSWNSLGGRTKNALENLQEAADAGAAHGARGYLITDWGDFGHLQPVAISLLPFFAGAGCAWRSISQIAHPSERSKLCRLLERDVLNGRGDSCAHALYQLGETYRIAGPTPLNGSWLFYLLLAAHKPLTGSRFAGLEIDGIIRTQKHLAEIVDSIRCFHPPHCTTQAFTRTVADDSLWAAQMLSYCCDLAVHREKIGFSASMTTLPIATRRALKGQLDQLIDRRRTLWDRHNRPGGREASLGVLARVGSALAV